MTHIETLHMRDEMLLLRQDTLSAMQPTIGTPAGSLFGMKVHVLPDHLKHLATVPHWKIERLPIKKRRKGYRVVCERRPCAFIINPSALAISPFNMRLDF